jgi:hypothetical protein
MTLATPDHEPSRRAPPGVIDPAGVARREAALIEVVRQHPGATLLELVEAAGGSRGAIVDRLRRLAARGAVEKIAGGGWRLAEGEPVAPEFELEPEADRPEPEPAPAHPRWIRNVNDYLRVESDVRDRPMRFG